MGLQRPEPQTIVIFGASGDLTASKVMPAFYDLFSRKLLPEEFSIVGYARSKWDDEEFRQRMESAVRENSRTGIDDREWSEFSSHLSYVAGEYSAHGCMAPLREVFASKSAPQAGKRLFYCATPPSTFGEIADRLTEEGLTNDSRIVIEKPFGHDLESARELNSRLHRGFVESQIFRIDHYLGKETVQNVLVFRFANGMFEPIWNRMYVQMVQIDVAEDVGIAGRGKFYEEAGAIRDILQNHILQLMATLAMEPPGSFDAESIRNEKVKLLRAVSLIDPAKVVRGQYVSGNAGGEQVPGYRQEQDVPNDSTTETFVALELEVQNWRWAGVPFFLRTGKRLPRRATTITVVFKEAPHMLFEESGISTPEPNHLTIRIQPDEGITLTFDAKVPGPEMKVKPVNMDFDYEESFMSQPAEAYERLLHDVMAGDATLFTRADEIERAWEIVGPILEKGRPDFYEAGSWGPAAADRLVEPHRWYLQ